MSKTIIKNAQLINRGETKSVDILIKDDRIERIDSTIDIGHVKEIDAEGCWIMPGIIDDQVHFREPGLTHKANIFSEATAAVAGGTTTFMEMPNTKPPATTIEKLEEKYAIGAQSSLPNYSFFMGASNENLEEVLKADSSTICGIKVFMGSSTGNMLVDNETTLTGIFSKAHMLVATHCEDEATIRANMAAAKEKYGEDIPIHLHPEIRSREACIKSSRLAIDLAKKYNSRLHILHISTAEEVQLFDAITPLENKRITAEACVHHLTFCEADYATLGTQIKCNPAIKSAADRAAIMQGVLDNHIDIIATDHAPHLSSEKANPYMSAPSGLPLVQHSLDLMMRHVQHGVLTKERMVEKMCHAPSTCFQIVDRGFADEGMFADLIIYDPSISWQVKPSNVLYKCGWSPLDGWTFNGKLTHTFVSGHLAYHNGVFDYSKKGQRVLFDRS